MDLTERKKQILKRVVEDYIAAAAAIVGVTVGSVLALVYMLIDYLRRRPRTLGRPHDGGHGDRGGMPVYANGCYIKEKKKEKRRYSEKKHP